jgi:hypothetical protein
MVAIVASIWRLSSQKRAVLGHVQDDVPPETAREIAARLQKLREILAKRRSYFCARRDEACGATPSSAIFGDLSDGSSS